MPAAAQPDADADDEAPLAATQSPVPYAPGIKPMAGDEVEPTAYAWFRAGDSGIGATLATVRDAIGSDRIASSVQTCQAFMKERKERVAMLRLTPKGQPHDSVEALRWVPEAWSTSGFAPEALRQHGAPWMMVTAPGTARATAATLPFYAQAHYLHVVSGRLFIMWFSTKAILDAGSTPAGTAELLASMTGKRFQEWSEAELDHAILGPGDGAWVPYGIQTVLIAMASATEDSPDAVSLLVPWHSGSLFRLCDERAEIIEDAATTVRIQMANNVSPWNKFGQQYLDFAAGVDQQAVDRSEATARAEILKGASSSGPPEAE